MVPEIVFLLKVECAPASAPLAWTLPPQEDISMEGATDVCLPWSPALLSSSLVFWHEILFAWEPCPWSWQRGGRVVSGPWESLWSMRRFRTGQCSHPAPQRLWSLQNVYPVFSWEKEEPTTWNSEPLSFVATSASPEVRDGFPPGPSFRTPLLLVPQVVGRLCIGLYEQSWVSTQIYEVEIANWHGHLG